MRSLIRMRTLAATCALLFFVAGQGAALVPGRPIEKPGDPPEPVQVGDPDAGHDMPVVLVVGGYVILWRIPLRGLRIPAFRMTLAPKHLMQRARR